MRTEKKNRREVIGAALCRFLAASCVVLAAVSCREPEPERGVSGSEIHFGGRTNVGLQTKTEYAGDYGKDSYDNSRYVERINWSPNDPLTIVSPSAKTYDKNTTPWGLRYEQGSGSELWSKENYTVTNDITAEGVMSEAKITTSNPSGNGLQWDQTGDYYFYAVYPKDGNGTTISWSGSGAGKATVTATLPSAQEKPGGNAYITANKVTTVKPDMNYAFMYAALKTKVERSGEWPEAYLDFYPMVTAFEFTVGAAKDENNQKVDIEIAAFELVSSTCDLSGAFTAEVTVGDPSSSSPRRNKPSGSYASYTGISGSGKKVSLEMPELSTNNPAIKVSSEDSVRFTVFVLPKGIAYQPGHTSVTDANLPGGTTITDLEIRFKIRKVGETNWTGRSLALKPKNKTNLNAGITLSANDYVEFPAGKKIRITNIQLPVQKDPWRFSVDVTDLVQEPSDVAVAPVEVLPWEPVTMPSDLDMITLKGTINGGTVPYSGGTVVLSESFQSCKTNGLTLDHTPLPWKLQFSELITSPDTWSDWSDTPPAWASVNRTASPGSLDGEKIVMTVVPQINSQVDPYHQTLSARTPKTDYDLSRVNVAKGTEGAPLSQTANCYVVQAPGTYKIPLVYGNALKDGMPNEAAYRAKDGAGGSYRPDEGTTHYLGRFLDHNGAYITGPWITERYPKSRMDAVLVWMDEPDLVTNVAISASEDYLTFSVPAEYITQGNALVAVRVDGTIAWSWHIWVTDAGQTATGIGFNGYSFAPQNIGWCEARQEKYEPRSLRVRVYDISTDTASDPEIVAQTGKGMSNNPAFYGNNPYFQWGRKDPIQASSGKPVASSSDPLERDDYANEQLYDKYKPYFPSLDSYSPSVRQVKSDLGTAVQTPYVFYVGNTPADWCATTYNNCWNAQFNETATSFTSVEKTIYDPSPAGYCVPPQAAFAGFTNDNFTWCGVNNRPGFVYQSVFFPIVGYTDYDGKIYGYGNPRYHSFNVVNLGTGSYWSASLDLSQYDPRLALYFGFGHGPTNYIRTTFSKERFTGHSVRPVVEGGSASGNSVGTSSYVLGGNPFE